MRTNDQLYKAKVKHYGLRLGARRCSQRARLAALRTHKGRHGASRCGAVPQYSDELSLAGSQNWGAVATQTAGQQGLEVHEAIM